MLCGVRPGLVEVLSKCLVLAQHTLQAASAYLFSFLVCHILVIHVLDRIY